ncbi:hypothetical protein R3I93_003682 [Phoxinus phoxinus]|uniref:Protein kinase domain-containing protein n=1 Tax=Phoxinus phoxinus TaxID=58324 RepID=A0AAN9DJS7_9TELE
MISRSFPDSRDIAMMDPDVWFRPGFSDECCRFIRGCLKSDPTRRLHLDEMRCPSGVTQSSLFSPSHKFLALSP